MSLFPLNHPHEKSFVEKYREILRRAGLKATHTRLHAAQYMVQTSGLGTNGEVMRGVGADQLDRATVFRILQVFSQVDCVVVHRRREREMQSEKQSSLPGHEQR